MSGKALVIFPIVLIFSIAGCARDRGHNATTDSSKVASASSQTTLVNNRSKLPKDARQRATKDSLSQITPTPTSAQNITLTPHPHQADLPELINADAVWITFGKTLLVSRGTHQPVPLFRQAIVLASTRAALAGSSLSPRAEFRHGVLSLTFTGGTNQQISTDINRVMAIREVTRLEVYLK